MALPPDESVNFQREVDENLRRDQMADFGKKYGKWIALGVILFLGAIAAFLFWQNQQREERASHGEELALIVRDIGNEDLDDVPQRLDALAAKAEGATKGSAMMARAAVALKQNQRDEAIRLYGEVAGDESLPDPYRDLATIRQTLLEYDRLEPDAIIARMQPLAQEGEPFYGTATELTGVALLRADRDQEAAQLFGKLASDESIPSTLRNRAGQLAATLGVDASAPLAQAQEGSQ